MSWCLLKFSQLVPSEIYEEHWGELALWHACIASLVKTRIKIATRFSSNLPWIPILNMIVWILWVPSSLWRLCACVWSRDQAREVQLKFEAETRREVFFTNIKPSVNLPAKFRLPIQRLEMLFVGRLWLDQRLRRKPDMRTPPALDSAWVPQGTKEWT